MSYTLCKEPGQLVREVFQYRTAQFEKNEPVKLEDAMKKIFDTCSDPEVVRLARKLVFQQINGGRKQQKLFKERAFASRSASSHAVQGHWNACPPDRD